jgi:CHAD domain-containing protein
LRLVRTGLRKRYERENGAFRGIARRLSGPRDIEIICATFDALLKESASATTRLDTERLKAWLTSRMDRLRSGTEEANVAGMLVEAVDSLTSIEGRIAGWRVHGEPIEILSAGFGRSYRCARREFKRTLEKQRASDFHGWRKHVKYHWYQLKLLRQIAGKALPGRMKRIGELAGMLGELHDLDVLEAWLSRQGNRAAAPRLSAVVRCLGQRRSELQRAAITLGESQFSRPPHELVEAIVKRRDANSR